MLPSRKRKSYKMYNKDQTIKVPIQTLRRKSQGIRDVSTSSYAGIFEDHSQNSECASQSPSSNSSVELSWQQVSPNSSSIRVTSAFNEDDSDVTPSSPDFLRYPVSFTPELMEQTSSSEADICIQSANTSFATTSLSSEGDDSSEDDEGENIWKNPLHSHTDVLMCEAVIDVITLYVRHKLSKACLDDMLQLIRKFLPTPNCFPGNKYWLYKLLIAHGDDLSLTKHRFCNDCDLYLGLFNATTDIDQCPFCGSIEVGGVFLEVPLEETLKNLLEVRHLYKYLKLKKSDSGIMTDISDGYLTSQHLTKEYPIVLLWNTDGVPVFNSSNAQIWPILFSIANLPPNIRQQNVCIAGIWFGNKKPVMNTFFQPFVNSLQNLGKYGLKWQHPEDHNIIISKVTAPIITVDARARSDMQGVVSCNGRYGCSFCEHEGEVVATGKAHVVVHPIVNPPPPLRNRKQMMMQAKVAVETGESKNGVVRPTLLSLVPSVDPATSFIPDYMHSVAQGVVRQFFWLWFDSQHHREAWYIGKKKADVDMILLTIRPPNDICRTPRSVSTGKHWKASEFRNWLLFYSPVCLKEILPKQFFQHWLLLVGGIYLLLQQEISSRDVELSHHLLHLFCEGIEELYSKRYMSFNVHQLLHLAESVKNWGPLWATSCFPFENVNGLLISLIHGTQRVSEQIGNVTKIIHSLQTMKQKLKIHSTSGTDPIKPLGAIIICPNAEVERAVANYSAANDLANAIFYARVEVADLGPITSKCYHREQLRSSSTIKFKNMNSESFGQVQCFIRYANKMYAVITAFKIEKKPLKFVHKGTGFALSHFITFQETNTIVIVPCEQVIQKVFNFGSFIGIPPNDVEKNL